MKGYSPALREDHTCADSAIPCFGLSTMIYEGYMLRIVFEEVSDRVVVTDIVHGNKSWKEYTVLNFDSLASVCRGSGLVHVTFHYIYVRCTGFCVY